ncbi:MAG: hypothetical protein GX456_03330, partial [Verrucomicrobia bacterium]|nr:hypothetical protein [Verrucomicrobiota bacterium]
MGVGRCEAFGVRQLAAAFVSMHKQRVCPNMAPFGLAADPDGFSRAAVGGVGVGRREAFGVRQLAAALFLCTNNVSVSTSRHEKPSERGVLKRHKTLKRNSVGNQSHPAKANHQPEAS